MSFYYRLQFSNLYYLKSSEEVNYRGTRPSKTFGHSLSAVLTFLYACTITLQMLPKGSLPYTIQIFSPNQASLAELTTYTPVGGGVFTRTRVLAGYFVAVVEEPSPVGTAMRAVADISILATGKTVSVRLPAYKQFPNNSRWPSVEMEGRSIVFLYGHHVLARYPTH